MKVRITYLLRYSFRQLEYLRGRFQLYLGANATETGSTNDEENAQLDEDDLMFGDMERVVEMPLAQEVEDEAAIRASCKNKLNFTSIPPAFLYAQVMASSQILHGGGKI